MSQEVADMLSDYKIYYEQLPGEKVLFDAHLCNLNPESFAQGQEFPSIPERQSRCATRAGGTHAINRGRLL